MTDDVKRLFKLQRRRRGHLKAALRKYASAFDMEYWFQRKQSSASGITFFTGAIDESDLCFEYVSPERKAELRKALPKRLTDFEHCGTACCIAGLDTFRSGRTIGQQLSFYGFPDKHVFNAGYWPDNLRKKYDIASTKKNHVKMVEVACEAIDFFGKKKENEILINNQ